MSEKTLKDFSVVNAGVTNDIVEHADVVPNGTVWSMQFFSAADINQGNNASSVYVIRFGTEILRFFVYTGNSDRVNLGPIEVTGNGTDKVNVMRMNYDSVNKRLPFVLEMYERA